jgi:membrane-associated phospholipid phosphatase
MQMDETRAAPAATFRAARRPWRPTRPWRPSLWLAPGLPALILVFLTVNVLARSPLLKVDRWVRGVVQAQANSAAWRWLGDTPHAPAQVIVLFGSNQVAIPVLAACALIAYLRRRSVRALLAAGACVVLLLVTVIPAKILIARPGPGPNQAHIASGGLGVFPSGHTTTASVCFLLGALLLVPGLPARIRTALVAFALLVCFLVGLALIWCNYHWFTDVVGGWALAAIIVQVCLVIARPGDRARDEARSP